MKLHRMLFWLTPAKVKHYYEKQIAALEHRLETVTMAIENKRPQMNFNPKDVKKALIDLDLSQSFIARELGLTPGAVNMILRGKGKSRRVDQAIEKIMKRHAQLKK